MAYIIDVDDVEMDTCEPDSTVEIIDVEGETVTQEQNPLQVMNHQLVERQHMCAAMVAASIRHRNRVRSELEETQKRRESVMADLVRVCHMSKRAADSLMDLKASLEEATRKRIVLLTEIELTKIWRPPSAEMSLKKQQELRERVEHMRTILSTGKICIPDD